MVCARLEKIDADYESREASAMRCVDAAMKNVQRLENILDYYQSKFG